MSIDLFAIPVLLNYDSAIDWALRLEREGPFLLQTLSAAPTRRLIDLGAGTGEHAHWLAAQGFTVVGIEGVKERFDVAKGRAVANVQHLLGDLGAVEAMVRGQFGGALALGNTLPALIGVETVARLLVGLRRRLLPGGIFVAQQLNYDRIFTGVGELPVRRLARDGNELVFRRTLEPRTDGIVGVTEKVFLDEPGGEEKVVHQRHFFQQGWRRDELHTLLDVAGFRRIEVYGGFAGEPFDAAASEELIVVAS